MTGLLVHKLSVCEFVAKKFHYSAYNRDGEAGQPQKEAALPLKVERMCRTMVPNITPIYGHRDVQLVFN